MPSTPAVALLVVANRTCPCPALIEEIAARSRPGDTSVLVVAPALNTRLRHWVSDVDAALRGARGRLDEAVAALAARDIAAEGAIGDADPLIAIEDALHDFPAAQIIISTHPPEQSNWLERRLPERARERFGVEVTHVVSRMGAEEEVAA